uniref:Anion exchange protein n=1 Tax=Plectus sambesii TaxID=2011161 RepID=A0A914WV03_9BILA
MFCELMELSTTREDDDVAWRELSRWIKYEQTVEGGGTRFSKPHITLLNVQSVLQLRNCLKRGVVILNAHCTSYRSLVELLIKSWNERHDIDVDMSSTVRDVLHATKLHLTRSRLRKITGDHANKVEEGKRQSRHSVQSSPSVDEPPTPTSLNASPPSSPAPASVDNSGMKNMPKDSESAIILVGHVDGLVRPVTAFVRLTEPQMMHPEVPELPIPVRFAFVLLNPHEHYQNETISIGRTMGALMVDEIFKKVAYNTNEPFTLADAVEEFFSQVVAVPPGKWNPANRWEPQDEAETELRSVGKLQIDYSSEGGAEPHEHTISGLRRTGKLFGGLREDIQRKLPFYISDYTDFFRGRISQSLAATLFLFFANITTIITFGAVMDQVLHHQMSAVENLLAGGISGVLFGLFSGQPLNILSATGPTLVFEKILYQLCVDNGWDFLPARFWVGIWTATFLLILVATDMSALVSLITRFTEEAFATLISIVFIVQAIEKLIDISNEAPLYADPKPVYSSPCFCHFNVTSFIEPNNTATTTLAKLKDIDPYDCEANKHGKPVGLQCFFKPDVFMFSVVLALGTFAIAFAIKLFRTSRFFPSKIRQSVADFGVFLAIVIMTAISFFVGLSVPTLQVPSSFRPTLDRSWIVDPRQIDNWWVAVVAGLPAIFYTILIVMDQQITAVIVNRKDNQLRKGLGYHLDLLIIVCLIVICSFLGIPFYVAATVLSIMHVDSLRLQSECSAPGVKPQFLGVKEQRLTAIIAHIMIGFSVLLTPVIKLVPLPVLVGIFLYMGVVSLIGQQFVQRILLLFMPLKHQPDYGWLRMVRMKRVHLFTLIQILSMVGLFAVKYTKQISIMFPLMLVFMVLIRMFVLERLFSPQELAALDDPLPSVKEVMSPGEGKTHDAVEMETYPMVIKEKAEAPNGNEEGKIKFGLVNEP